MTNKLVSWREDTLKVFSDDLIKRGVRPDMRRYSRVRPRGLYMLFPSMWYKAKLLEQVSDYSYDILMMQATIEVNKIYLEALRRARHV